MKPLICAGLLTAVSASVMAESHQQEVATEYMQNAGSRAFSIEYVGKITGVPDGTKKLRVWMPVPQNSTVQTIRNLRFSQHPAVAIEPKYGNKIALGTSRRVIIPLLEYLDKQGVTRRDGDKRSLIPSRE